LIKKYFTCAIILEKNKKGYSVVVGLKIADFPGISTIDIYLSNFCKRTLIEIVKKLT
jgi:hypothetical protein